MLCLVYIAGSGTTRVNDRYDPLRSFVSPQAVRWAQVTSVAREVWMKVLNTQGCQMRGRNGGRRLEKQQINISPVKK